MLAHGGLVCALRRSTAHTPRPGPQEALGPDALLATARAGGRAGAAAASAYVDGRALTRGALLGAERGVDTLLRAGRGRASTVYELVLTG